MTHPLIQCVRNDVEEFLKSLKELLFNEREFQMQLAMWLRESHHYDDVQLEYHIPKSVFNGDCRYVWKNDVRLDLVVEKEKKFCIVELKYKTQRSRKPLQIDRFNQKLTHEVEILKTQGAQDLGMYAFWKDIRRIELVNHHFLSTLGGLAVFLTNDCTYVSKNKVHKTPNHEKFSTSTGIYSTEKRWRDAESACAKKHPAFEVDRPYEIKWEQTVIKGIDFYYSIVTIA